MFGDGLVDEGKSKGGAPATGAEVSVWGRVL